jgi:hypothetical protein
MPFKYNPITNVLDISDSNSASGPVETLTGNTGGPVSPSGGNINVVGTGSISVAGSGSTLTISNSESQGIVTIDGDSGSMTGTTVTISGGTTGLTTSASSATMDLTGTLVVKNGGTGVASTTAYAVLCGGTTSTGALQSIASVGTSGQVLTSNGAGALPTFQAMVGGLALATVTLTSSQIQNLNGTPITLVSAQGAGTVIVPVSLSMYFFYGGNNAFTGGSTIEIYYTNSSGTNIESSLTTAIMTGTASKFLNQSTFTIASIAPTNVVNQPIIITDSVNYAGNAAGDNTLSFSMLYYVVQGF